MYLDQVGPVAFLRAPMSACHDDYASLVQHCRPPKKGKGRADRLCRSSTVDQRCASYPKKRKVMTTVGFARLPSERFPALGTHPRLASPLLGFDGVYGWCDGFCMPVVTVLASRRAFVELLASRVQGFRESLVGLPMPAVSVHDLCRPAVAVPASRRAFVELPCLKGSRFP